MALTLGTAGHIDHGKSALVEALTGARTDRLAEERRRGISIELGFAELELGDGGSLSVVDVPGHESLVRTMIAGAGAIDLFLLVVAADDGPMPQTTEHLAVLRALGVEPGVVALTKADLVAPERLELVGAEVAALVPGATVVAVSSVTGAGIEDLRGALAALASELESRGRMAGETVLHADRVFSLAGAGTVATGTLLGGPLARGDELRSLPGGARVRVRSLESHDSPAERLVPGQRVAVALSGADRTRIERGDALLPEGSPLAASYRLDVRLLPPLRPEEIEGERVQVHAGTREAPARIVALGSDLAQLRLESPLVARPFDRVLLRRIAPVATLGGARVIDPAPRRHGASSGVGSRLDLIEAGEPEEILLVALSETASLASAPADWDLATAAGLARRRFSDERWGEAAAALGDRGEAHVAGDRLAAGQRPDGSGENPAQTFEPDRIDTVVLALIERGGAEPPSFGTIAERVGLEVGRIESSASKLAGAGLIVRLGRDLAIAPDELGRLRDAALAAVDADGALTLAGVRDRLGTSRRYAQALLEHLDATRVTVRRGDRHVLRGSAGL